jgi:dihydroxy-acid dehydratase
LKPAEIDEIEGALCATGGTCMVMGTASTMACLMETLGLMLPGGATPPHTTGERLKNCVASGRHAVHLAQTNLRPRDILTAGSFTNALTVLLALSGSTNAIIHLFAMARRAGIPMSIEALNTAAARVPVLVDCKPAGTGYLEDLHYAGGVPVLLKELAPLLDTGARLITGRTLGEELADVAGPGEWQTTIRTLAEPLKPGPAITALFGSLAPDGAVIKSAAATPALMQHRGPAAVFESSEDAAVRLDDPALNLTPDHVLVLRHAGPRGKGMPEAGSLPIPKYLAEQGVRDMVRVSDARMSGTAYGTVVLHCAPEATAGGPLALVQDGDLIELDVGANRVDLLVDETELAERRTRLVLPDVPERGWRRLYAEHVLQASEGADLDFL